MARMSSTYHLHSKGHIFRLQEDDYSYKSSLLAKSSPSTFIWCHFTHICFYRSTSPFCFLPYQDCNVDGLNVCKMYEMLNTRKYCSFPAKTWEMGLWLDKSSAPAKSAIHYLLHGSLRSNSIPCWQSSLLF